VAVAGLAAVALAGCSRVAELRERVAPASPHERYAERLRAAGLESTALGAGWLRAADAALVAARPVTLPAREAAYLAPDETGALGYRARLRRGERLVVEVEAGGGAPALVFVDLYRREPEPAGQATVAADGGAAPAVRFERLASADSAGARVETVAREDGEVVVRLQPELLRGGRDHGDAPHRRLARLPGGGAHEPRGAQLLGGRARRRPPPPRGGGHLRTARDARRWPRPTAS
jgi:hypothetical protein